MRYKLIVLATTMFATMLGAITSTVRAQSTQLPQSSTSADPYVRYTRPGQCAQAARRLNDQYWRDKRADTVVYAPATDSVPASVITAAKACASRFNVTHVPPRDLLSLVQLYLWTQQDTLARMAATRLLTTDSTRSKQERGWTLYQLVLSYLNGKPVRLDDIQLYVTQLDALGPSASTWRLFVHTAMSRYMMSLNDLPAALTEASAALAAGTQMTKSDRADRVFSLVGAYNALAEPTSIRTGGPAAVAIFDTATMMLPPLRAPASNGGRSGDMPRATHGAPDMVVHSRDDPGMLMAMMSGLGAMGGPDAQMMLKQDILEAQHPYTIVGGTAPPLQASHWYATGNDTGPRPKLGTVTLVVSVSPNCGATCHRMYASIRRLYNAYHTAGFQIILMSSTVGFFRNQPAPVPATEAEKIRGYYVDFLKLPGILGVDETQFSHRADGRRINAPGQSREDYFRGINAVVVGKDGKVRLADNLAPDREQVFRAVIADALGK